MSDVDSSSTNHNRWIQVGRENAELMNQVNNLNNEVMYHSDQARIAHREVGRVKAENRKLKAVNEEKKCYITAVKKAVEDLKYKVENWGYVEKSEAGNNEEGLFGENDMDKWELRARKNLIEVDRIKKAVWEFENKIEFEFAASDTSNSSSNFEDSSSGSSSDTSDVIETTEIAGGEGSGMMDEH